MLLCSCSTFAQSLCKAWRSRSAPFTAFCAFFTASFMLATPTLKLSRFFFRSASSASNSVLLDSAAFISASLLPRSAFFASASTFAASYSDSASATQFLASRCCAVAVASFKAAFLFAVAALKKTSRVLRADSHELFNGLNTLFAAAVAWLTCCTVTARSLRFWKLSAKPVQASTKVCNELVRASLFFCEFSSAFVRACSALCCRDLKFC
mmetsp:Transcript_103505/g.179747  ORF Transcript_103505/g.179747 Transcript_103505/m.179747 type:complete len:210 (+) Transcript_103505:248-877(+)